MKNHVNIYVNIGNTRLAEARASVNAIRTAGADTFAAAVAPVIREAQAAGAKSLRQIAAALNARGIATARGGKWEAATVANVLKRAAASDGADSVASQIRDASGRVKRGRSSKVR